MKVNIKELAQTVKASAKNRVKLHKAAYTLSTNEGKREALRNGADKEDIRAVQAEAKSDYVKVGIAVGATLFGMLVD